MNRALLVPISVVMSMTLSAFGGEPQTFTVHPSGGDDTQAIQARVRRSYSSRTGEYRGIDRWGLLHEQHRRAGVRGGFPRRRARLTTIDTLRGLDPPAHRE